MTLLNSLPHTVEIQIRSTSQDELGADLETWTTVSGQDEVEAWVQPAGMAEIDRFAKRGQRVSKKVYFADDPSIDDRHRIVYNDVPYRFVAFDNADAGLDVLWKAFVDDETPRDDA